MTRIKKILDSLHDGVDLGAPLFFDKRGHVAPRTVLGFEGTIITVHYQVDHFEHERFVFFDFRRVAEIRGQHKMYIAVEDMPPDDTVAIVVFLEQFLQFEQAVTQVLDRHGDVFDNDGRAHVALRTGAGENALAHLPQGRGLFRIACKGVVMGHFDGLKLFLDLPDIGLQSVLVIGRGFHQQGGHLRPQGLDVGRHPGLVLDGSQGQAIDQLRCLDRALPQDENGLTGRGDIRKKHQARGLGPRLFSGPKGNIRNKRQRTLRSDDQMLDHFDRIVLFDQGVDTVAGGVLDLVFPADFAHQSRIVFKTIRQFSEVFDPFFFLTQEGLAAMRVAGV